MLKTNAPHWCGSKINYTADYNSILNNVTKTEIIRILKTAIKKHYLQIISEPKLQELESDHYLLKAVTK